MNERKKVKQKERKAEKIVKRQKDASMCLEEKMVRNNSIMQ